MVGLRGGFNVFCVCCGQWLLSTVVVTQGHSVIIIIEIIYSYCI